MRVQFQCLSDEPARALYAHDCAACVHLATDQGRAEDIYLCGRDLETATIIRRFGADGPEYHSMPLRFADLIKGEPEWSFAVQEALAHWLTS